MVDAGMRGLGPVRRGLLTLLGVLLAAAPLAAAQAAEKTIQRVATVAKADAALVDDDGLARVIVKYRQGSSMALTRRGAGRLGAHLQLALEDGHVLGQRSQSLRARGLSAQALATRLATDPDVEWAQPVRRKTVRAGLPNDPLFGDHQASATPVVGQWFLRAPDATLVSAVNAVGAWAITPGSASVTVAVLDTGVRFEHPDLVGKLWQGYDFVSHASTANDNDPGRDADASDPGDGATVSDSCYDSRGDPFNNSSWHGTQVAGLIGAATDNGAGVAGAGRDTMVLPVRVLGKCGGYDDDIIAGMRWAAGLSATPVANPHPARVLNLSLGSSGACSPAYRDVIAELNAAGVVVVVASGNDTGHAVNEPANCPGALAVAGVRHAGTKVGYSNLGPQIAIAAPAGNCVNDSPFPCLYPLVTTLNAGTTTPGASIYSSSDKPSLGTSFATPLVAASAALMLAINPALTPAQVKALLQASARPFPVLGAGSNGALACKAPSALDQVECYCTTSTCGAGLLDAGGAIARAAGQSVPALAVFQAALDQPTVGMRVQLDGGPSSTSVTGRGWSVVSGAARAGIDGATNGMQASLLTQAAGPVVVRMTATDAIGNTVSVDKTIQVKTGPTAGFTVSQPWTTVGGAVQLDASGSAVMPGRNLGYSWALKGRTNARFISARNASTASFIADSEGADLTVELTVTDTFGESHSTTQTLDVGAAPVATISPSDMSPPAGANVRLDGSASTVAAGHSVARYEWSVASGGNLAQISNGGGGAVATLATSAPGTVGVLLRITDDAGSVSTAESTITVAAAPVVVTPGGGGALGGGWLLGLAAAVLLLARSRPQH